MLKKGLVIAYLQKVSKSKHRNVKYTCLYNILNSSIEIEKIYSYKVLVIKNEENQAVVRH